MTKDTHNLAKQAEGKIKIGLMRLIGKYPFHVAIIERFKLIVRPDIKTMAVTVLNGELILYFNPKFVLGISVDELGGVLLHETHHVLLGHLTANPADYPDEWAHTVAMEISVNEFISEPLPPVPITLKMYPKLPRMESTLERYKRLLRTQKDKRKPIGQGPPSPADTLEPQDTEDLPPPTRKAASREPNSESDQLPATGLDQPSDSTNRDDQGVATQEEAGEEGSSGNDIRSSRNSRSKKGPAKSPRPIPSPIDDHSVWSEARQDLQQSEAAIRDAIQQAAQEVGIDQVPERLRKVCEGVGAGSSPSEAERDVRGERPGQMPWQRLLHQYVGQILEVRPVFTRPPRRFPELVGVIPAKGRQEDKPRILAIIDTSGSITEELLELIDAELARLAKSFDVTVVECDCEIHAVYRYKRVKTVQGGGGTDFRPPLEPAFLRKQKPDLIVYFTDGDGPAPEKPPRVPVIWCLVPEGERPAAWGREIRMVEMNPADEIAP